MNNYCEKCKKSNPEEVKVEYFIILKKWLCQNCFYEYTKGRK